jgi:hypothetical protein
MKDFCQTTPWRQWHNLWHFNAVCDACFQLQLTYIGVLPCYFLTVADPLASVAVFSHLSQLVFLVDFDPAVHHDLGGSFSLLCLTDSIVNCRGFYRHQAGVSTDRNRLHLEPFAVR